MEILLVSQVFTFTKKEETLSNKSKITFVSQN